MMKELIVLTSVSIIISVTGNNIEKSIFPPLPIAVSKTDNLKCKEHSELYTQSLENFTLWAYEMWDATAKSSAGILRGSQFQLGHFHQCLSADAPFLTKYCLTFWQANVPTPKHSRDPLSLYHHPNEHLSERLYPHKDVSQQVRNILQVGWCIPASCSPQDLEKFLNIYASELDIPIIQENVTYSARVTEISCSTKEDNRNLNTADICFCTLLLILVTLVIISTLCDFNRREPKDEKPTQRSFSHRIFMSFSARKNFNELTKNNDSNSALSILYGIRTICIFFIIMDHRFGTFTGSALSNFDYVEEQYRQPLAPFLFHGDMFVDTFFIMGGLLVTYGLLNQLDKKKLNPGFIILMRYIRLTPAYAFVIFYYATVYNYTGTGPFWKVIAGQESQDCKDNWWLNLLYINNYVNSKQICMAHSWYLPCDFHYFIISIGVCLLIHKKKKLGLFTLLLLTIISIIIPFAITIVYQRPALLHFYPEFLTGPKIHPDFQLTYIKSHTRATSYFIGIFIGYIYYRVQEKEIRIGWVKSYCLLVVSASLMLLSIVGGASFYDPYHTYNAWESATYAGLHRPAFDLGTVGIMYLCSYGQTGFLRKIFTWSPWIPLSKLVFGAYLFHMQFQLRYASIFTSPREFSYFDVFNLALGDTVMSFIAGLLLYLLVEEPFRKIFKELLMPKRVSPPEHSTNTTNINENIRNGIRDSRL